MMEQSEIGNRLNGFYRGKVVKHLSNGMCKVYVPGVYPAKYSSNTDEADNLPDAEQITPLFGGSNKGNGVFSYPNLGSVVIVGFWNGDQNLPFFFGSTLGGDQAQEQYPEARGETSDDSVKSGDDARVHKITVDKTTIKIWESGKLQIKTFEDRAYNTGDEQPDAGCQIDISKDGNINIWASNQIHIESPVIQVDTNQFTMNAQTMKINNGSDIDIRSDTIMEVVDSKITTKTSTHNQIAKESFFTISPAIKIDGKEGSVGIFGKTHPPIFI